MSVSDQKFAGNGKRDEARGKEVIGVHCILPPTLDRTRIRGRNDRAQVRML